MTVDVPQKIARTIGYDVLRITSTYMVVVLHTAGLGFYAFESESWAAANMWDSLVRPSVPLFLMLTGALLLTRENDVGDAWRRIFVLVVPLVFWSIAYMVWFSLTPSNWLQPTDLWTRKIPLLSGPVITHFWYLYTLLGLYLVLPLLRSAFHARRSVRLHVTVCSIVFAFIVPAVTSTGGQPLIGVEVPALSWPVSYLLLGGVIAALPPPKRSGTILATAVFLASGVATAYLTGSASRAAGHAVETYYTYPSIAVGIGAIAAFYACRGISLPSRQVSFVLGRIARAMFGIYIIHMAILFHLWQLGVDFHAFNSWIAIPAVALLNFTISLVIVLVIQSAPGGKAILPG